MPSRPRADEGRRWGGRRQRHYAHCLLLVVLWGAPEGLERGAVLLVLVAEEEVPDLIRPDGPADAVVPAHRIAEAALGVEQGTEQGTGAALHGRLDALDPEQH